jgi:hypothetical protein
MNLVSRIRDQAGVTFAAAPREPAFTTPDARSGEFSGAPRSWIVADGCDSVRLRVLGQAFKDAQQVEVAAGSRAGTAGKVFSRKMRIHTVAEACDSTTADRVAMRRPSRTAATKSAMNLLLWVRGADAEAGRTSTWCGPLRFPLWLARVSRRYAAGGRGEGGSFDVGALLSRHPRRLQHALKGYHHVNRARVRQEPRRRNGRDSLPRLSLTDRVFRIFPAPSASPAGTRSFRRGPAPPARLAGACERGSARAARLPFTVALANLAHRNTPGPAHGLRAAGRARGNGGAKPHACFAPPCAPASSAGRAAPQIGR